MGPFRRVTKGQMPWPAPPRSTSPASPPSLSFKLGSFRVDAPRRPICCNGPSWSCCCTTSPTSPTLRLVPESGCTLTPSASGVSVGPKGSLSSTIRPAGGASPRFPPLDRAQVTALACEQVARTKNPISRQSLGDLSRLAKAALGQPISPRTVARILDEDAIKPWRYEYWIFPRDPHFAEKAGRVLDLYAGRWQGQRLGLRDYVISSDEKTSIQARLRCHPTVPPGPGRCRRVEHEYERGGALQYLAGWDVVRGCVMGRCDRNSRSHGNQVERKRKVGKRSQAMWTGVP